MKKIEFIYGHNPQQIFIWHHKYRDDEAVTAHQVYEDSKVAQVFKLDLAELSFACYKEKVNEDYLVKDGDRISLLRNTKRHRSRAPREDSTPRRRMTSK